MLRVCNLAGMSNAPSTVDRLRRMLRKLLPHLVAIAGMIIIVASFYPKAFKNHRNKMVDIEHYIATSKEVDDWWEKHDRSILWSDNMFGGMPTFQLGANADFQASKYITNTVMLGFPRPANYMWLAMISAYILALVLGCSPWIAALVGIGFGLSSVNVLYLSAGHAAKVRAIATMPGVLAGILLAYRRSLWGGATLALMWTTMHIASNHPQMSYYLLYLLVAVAVVEAVRMWGEGALRKFIKVSAILAATGALAILPSTDVLAPTVEYMPQTTRGESILSESEDKEQDETGLYKGYVLQYSMSQGEWWSVIVPDIKGGSSPYYWGEQLFTAGAFYFGAVLFSLFLMSLILMRDRIRWAFLVVGALAIVLSWRDASWLTDFFLDSVPGFSKFRDTKMMLVLLQLMTVVGVGILLRDAVNSKLAWGKKLWLSAAAPAVLLIAFYLFPELFFDFQSYIRPDQAIEQVGMGQALSERLKIFRADTARSIGFAMAAGIGLLAVVKMSADAKLSQVKWLPIAALVGISTVDLFQVDRRYQSADKGWIKFFDYMYPWEATPSDLDIFALETQGNAELLAKIESAVQFEREYVKKQFGNAAVRGRNFEKVKHSAEFSELKENNHYRIVDLQGAFNDARSCYFHRNVGGYHGAKLRRYQDLIDHMLMPEQRKFIEQANTDLSAALARMPMHNMLNTKYLVYDKTKRPLPNPLALGPGWFASSIEMAGDPDDEIARLKRLTNPRHAIVPPEHAEAVAALNVSGPASLAGPLDPGTASVELTEYIPDAPSYHVDSEKGGLVIFSEIHYDDGWAITIDGQPAELLRVNYLLRAVVVPPGAHDIHMSFSSRMFSLGVAASLLGGILVLLLITLGIVRVLRQQWAASAGESAVV